MINLTSLQITLLDGSIETIDLSKDMAQAIFQNTSDIREHQQSLILYEKGEIEDTQENREMIANHSAHFKAFVQVAINSLFKPPKQVNK